MLKEELKVKRLVLVKAACGLGVRSARLSCNSLKFRLPYLVKSGGQKGSKVQHFQHQHFCLSSSPILYPSDSPGTSP